MLKDAISAEQGTKTSIGKFPTLTMTSALCLLPQNVMHGHRNFQKRPASILALRDAS